MTKQEQKNKAFKAYEAIMAPAFKTYEAIRDSAYKDYEDTIDQAFKAYLAKCKEIYEQEDEIKIIDGKRYKLIN